MKQVALEKLLRFTKQFIKLRTMGHLWNALKKLHYADVASLIEQLTPSEQDIILKLFFERKMEMSQLAEIISEIRPELAVGMLARLPIECTLDILSVLSSDDAASLVALFPEEQQLELLKRMKKEDAVDVSEQLAYPEESAGRIMSADFLALDESTTAGDAIAAIQLAGEDVEVPFYLYVTDAEQHLKGVVSLKTVILVKSKLTLKEIMTPEVYKVDVYTDQEEVAAVVANYNLLAIPVVDEFNHLVGVVTVDDVVDIIHDEATEDIYKLAGVTTDYSIDMPFFLSLTKRIPLLLLSLLTTAVSAWVIFNFQATLSLKIGLTILMTIAPAIGGIVGNQTVAIMVREIVLGNLEWKGSSKLLLKELAVAAGSGLVIGTVGSILSSLIFGDWKLGLVFGGAIVLNLFSAGLFGTLIPLGLRKLKMDPALASGMLVSMLTDVGGLLGFLGLASLFLL
jgi:magnesium transporter